MQLGSSSLIYGGLTIPPIHITGWFIHFRLWISLQIYESFWEITLHRRAKFSEECYRFGNTNFCTVRFGALPKRTRRRSGSMVDCHKHLKFELKTKISDEKARLNRLWALRALGHGSFLKGEQFENIFFDSPGTIPPDLPSMPHLLTLGFCNNPKEFAATSP